MPHVVDARRARELAQFLRELRERAHLTQEELADRSGLSIRAISDLERGRTTRPQRKSVAMLAEALRVDGTSLDDFRRVARDRAVARCPACATCWSLDELVGGPAPSTERMPA